MREDPGPRAYLERALAISKFEPGNMKWLKHFCRRRTEAKRDA
jgi:hypothetical protein